jgi:hypothetical protein
MDELRVVHTYFGQMDTFAIRRVGFIGEIPVDVFDAVTPFGITSDLLVGMCDEIAGALQKPVLAFKGHGFAGEEPALRPFVESKKKR